jgi:hypothetical protein
LPQPNKISREKKSAAIIILQIIQTPKVAKKFVVGRPMWMALSDPFNVPKNAAQRVKKQV